VYGQPGVQDSKCVQHLLWVQPGVNEIDWQSIGIRV
jgi:hypothetical protein